MGVMKWLHGTENAIFFLDFFKNFFFTYEKYFYHKNAFKGKH